MKKSKLLIPMLAVVAVASVGCAVDSKPGQQGVLVSSWGSPTINGCVKEEEQTYTTDDIYNYPARSISWDANSDPGAERGPYVALSKPASPPLAPGQVPDANFSTGQAEMAIPMTITFDMTTDCDKLKDFHRNYGTKYNGWLNSDGSPSDGWKQLLNYTISQPAEQAVINITAKYPYQKVWNDESVRGEYKDALQARLQRETAARTGGVEYFTNFQVTVGKPWPTDQRLRDAMSLQQSAQAEANAKQTSATAEANARKSAAEAELSAAIAETNTEKQNALKKAAEIAGFPDIDSYLRDQCIQRAPSCTPWPQPVFNN